MPRTIHHARYSVLEHLSRPGDPASERVKLGVILEVTRSRGYFFGLTCRTELTESELSELNEVTRELLRRPFDYFKGEFEKVLKTSTHPNQFFDSFLDANAWSIHATPPKSVEVRFKFLETRKQAVQSQLDRLFRVNVAGQPKDGLVGNPRDYPAMPPWMIPQTTIERTSRRA